MNLLTTVVMRWTRRTGAVLAVAIFAGAAPAIAAETSLRMSSDPGDYIGMGQEYFYAEADGAFLAQTNYNNGVSVSFHTPNYEHWWYLDFAAADRAPLAQGLYAGAVRFPFQGPGQPGLSVYGDGRGCNQLTGAFEVKQISFDGNGAVSAFWAVFEQHCEGGEPALTGDIRFGADVVVAVKAPFSRRAPRGALLTFVVIATEVSGNPVSLAAEGLPAGSTFTDHGDNTGTFEWTPPADWPLGPLTVRFRGDNGLGRTDSAATNIDVRGVTRLYMKSEPGDYIGGGQTYLYGEGSGVFQPYSNYDNGVSLSFHTQNWSDWWYLDFAAPDRAPLDVGSYPNATRFPFQGPGEAGLDVSGNGRGCNMLTGSFDVRQLSRHPDGSIMSFWATFEQHCEGGSAALHGDVKYNADVTSTNQPPTADAGPDQRVECASFDGSTVQLDGSSSSDPDGDALTFSWTAPGVVFDDPSNSRPSAVFPFGATTVTLAVSDGQDTSTDTVLVSVIDTTPPEITVAATPSVLRPPNHDLRDVTVTVTARDVCDPSPSFVLSTASSNEPENGLGDGDAAPDIVGADLGADDTSLQLRAERSGNGRGRLYTLTYVARDASDNQATAAAEVRVPHDMRRGDRPRSVAEEEGTLNPARPKGGAKRPVLK